MRTPLLSLLFLAFCRAALATQADDVTITLTGQTPGATPFLSQVALSVSDTFAIKSIQFAIASKPGSTVRPLSGTYSRSYLAERGNIVGNTIFLPVYGLYDGYGNTVTLTYLFNDGSSRQAATTITTTVFDDPCDYKTPTILQPKIEPNSLSYDYMLLKGSCGPYSPVILDTDGALRWVGTADISFFTLALHENSIYLAFNSELYRNDLDGTVTFLGDFRKEGVNAFHHNVDRGKFGLLFEADTDEYYETIIMEIDTDGELLKTWNMAEIVSAAMLAGGDDPAEFVFNSPDDWFHHNATTYNRADDSLVISAREDFVICIDYESGAIKWILGDPEKYWYQFPSLRQYALTLAPGSLPPIGQHAVSITHDQCLLLMDNGMNSIFHEPPGALRTYASPRKYRIDLETRTATEVWNYPLDETVNSPYCSSVYEDLPFNYLVDYSFVFTGITQPVKARILGLDGTGVKVFDYQYDSAGCTAAFNAVPLHLESTAFPAVGPQSLNVSTRGLVSPDQGALIGGLIVTGSEAKMVVLRAIGPSLGGSVAAGTLANPVLTLYDAAGVWVAANDDWQAGPSAAQLIGDGLAPDDPAEAALRVSLAPGSYTAVVTGKDEATGVGLVEAYDVSATTSSTLANLSTRGNVGTGDDLLIAGFIVGQLDSSTVVVRALGPSLGAAGIADPLGDPSFTVYDQYGAALAANDDWQDDPGALDLEQNQLDPPDAAEAATILHLPVGAYTAVTAGAAGGKGIGLIEVYNLE